MRVSTHRLASLGLVLLGCSVEPPYSPPEVVPDAGRRDAATPDAAAPSCLLGQVSCDPGTYCAADGRCLPYPALCSRTSSCAPGLSCVGGSCARPPRGCGGAADCAAREVCTSPGFCGRALAEGTGALPECARAGDCTLDQLHGLLRGWSGTPACAEAQECGPDGVCAGGQCTGCLIDADCPGTLACGPDTFCAERAPCRGDQDCYPGNRCVDRACARVTSGCRADPANDSRAGAQAVVEAYHGGLSLCGADHDWYAIEVGAGRGLVVTLTSTPALGTVLAEVVGEDGLAAPEQERLELPGLLAIDVAAQAEERTLYVHTASPDVSVAYALDLRTPTLLCPRDPLDLYGQELTLAADQSYVLRACLAEEDRARVALTAGDALGVRLELDPGAALTLELHDPAGARVGTAASPGPGVLTLDSGRVAQAGEYTVVVRAGAVPSAGAVYRLTLDRRSNAREEACATPATVALLAGTTTLSGSLAGRADLGGPTRCDLYGPRGRNDALYALVPPSSPGVLRGRVRQTNGPSTATVSLSLLARCNDDEAEPLACDASPRPLREATFTVLREDTQPLFLLVSSEGAREDVDYALVLEFIPAAPPANDTCAGAQDLASSGVLSASTYGARRDAELLASGVCGLAGDGAGPDRFYRLSLAAGERAALELSGERGGLLWVGTDCALLTATCTAAADIGIEGGAVVTLAPRAARSYYVAVDGVGANDAGFYQLRTVRGAELGCLADRECTAGTACDDYRCRPPPPGDACPGAPVTFTDGRALIQGSTGAALDHYQLCVAATGGRDVVYRVDVPAGIRALSARVVSAHWDPVLSIRTTCESPAGEVCNDDVRFPELILPEVRRLTPGPGTYYVVLDAFSGRGPFELELLLEP